MSRKDSAKQNDDTLFHKFSELFNKHLYGEFYSDFNFILQMSGEDKVEFDQTKLKELFLSAYNNRMELEGELIAPALLLGDRLKESLYSPDKRHTVLDHVGKSFNLAVKELRIVPQKIQKHLGGRPTEQAVEDRRKFNPRRCGGKELCIVVSYSKDGNRDSQQRIISLRTNRH